MSNSTSNTVVAFNGNGERASGLNAAQSSAIARRLKTTASDHLKKLFQSMFDNVDDFLFDMANKAETSAGQTAKLDAMRHVRLKKEEMLTAFIRGFESNYNAALTKSSAKAALNASSLDSLLLVEHDDLEENLAVTNMIAKVRGANKEALYALEQRLQSVYQGQAEITPDNNPVGPQVVCNAFKGAVKVLATELKLNLIVYKLFDRYAAQHLATMYDDLNVMLVDEGILPHIRVRGRTQAMGARPSASRPGAPQSFGAANPNYIVSEEPMPAGGWQNEMFGTLQSLLNAQRGAGGNVAPSGDAYETPAVLNALSELQHVTNAPLTHFKNGEDLSRHIKQGIVSQLATGPNGAKKQISQIDADTIDIVAMLFDFILDDKNLPNAMKALLLRLQIPLLKVAMLDKSFFSKKNHPARRLLNELSHAGLGWSEADSNGADPLYAKIEHVVNRVLNEFESDPALFTQLLGEFTAFMEAEKNQRKLDAERLENAKQAVADEIEKRITANEVPWTIRAFITTAWKDVLMLIYSRDGDSGRAWQTALATADDLIWSVNPKVDKKQKQRLVLIIPKLLNGLQDGLTLINYPRAEKERLFRELEKLHIASLKGDGQPKPAPTPSAPKPATLDGAIAELENVPMLMEEIVMSETPDAPVEDSSWRDEYAGMVERLAVGTWVEFLRDNGKMIRAKLLWKSDVMGEYTFVDRMYKVVADKTTRELAADFRELRANVVTDVPLLDRALDAVVSGLKKKRNAAVAETTPA